MIKKVRLGVFETNSSSTHTICIVPKEDYEKFKRGELMYDYGNLVEPDEENEDLQSFENFGEDFETYSKSYTTKSGEEIVAFGYYGNDN